MSDDVQVVSPTGELGTVPANELKKDLELYGFKLPTPEILKENEQSEKFGTNTQALGAFAESAGSAATFGLSRKLESILNIASPEEQALRQRYNPLESAVGTGAGLLGSSFLLPGGGLVGGVGKAGQAVTKGVGSLLGEGLAARVVSHALGSAVEGAAYGVGQSIDEQALGDPNLTAQKVFSNIGLGALIGGGLGAGLGILNSGASKTLQNASKPIEESPAIGEAESAGKVEFGIPDEKIIERADKLNPKNPLKQNDLDFIKKEGMPDAEGKPTIFSKIGTLEVPTLDPMAPPDQVYMGDTIKEGMKNLQNERTRLNNLADQALAETKMPNGEPLSMTKQQYVNMFENVISDIKGTKEFGLPIGKAAVKKLNTWVEAADSMPDQIPATDIRDILQNVRDEGKIYVKGGGLKNDFVSKSMEKVQSNLDDYLKDNSLGYKNVQKEFAPFTRKMIEMEDHLDWNWAKNDSDLVSDWVTNRVAKPFQSSLPGNKSQAELLRWFSDFAGTDLERASKANFIFGKLNPDLAAGGQAGSWGSRMVEGLDLLKRPGELPGKALSGAAKIALTGEMPEFYQNIQSKEVQNMLLGSGKAGSQSARKYGSKLVDLMRSGSSLIGQEGIKPLGIKAGMSLLGGTDDAHDKIDTLSAIERASKLTDQKIESSIRAVLNGEKIGEPMEISNISGMNAQDRAELLDKISNKVNQMISNPETIIEAMGGNSKLAKHAPNIDAMAKATAMRALQYIQGILPNTNRLPLDPKYTPSVHELKNIMQAINVINRPISALHDLSNGTISRSQMNALKSVHPDLYEYMKAKTADLMTSHIARGKKVPANKQLGISYFMQSPLHNSATPEFIQKNQQIFAAPQPTQQNPIKGGQATFNSMNKGLESKLTPTQRAAAR